MDGLPESRLPDERAAGVALIFQGYNLLDALTAADNVALADLLHRPEGRGSSDAARHECRGSGASDSWGDCHRPCVVVKMCPLGRIS